MRYRILKIAALCLVAHNALFAADINQFRREPVDRTRAAIPIMNRPVSTRHTSPQMGATRGVAGAIILGTAVAYTAKVAIVAVAAAGLAICVTLVNRRSSRKLFSSDQERFLQETTRELSSLNLNQTDSLEFLVAKLNTLSGKFVVHEVKPGEFTIYPATEQVAEALQDKVTVVDLQKKLVYDSMTQSLILKEISLPHKDGVVVFPTAEEPRWRLAHEEQPTGCGSTTPAEPTPGCAIPVQDQPKTTIVGSPSIVEQPKPTTLVSPRPEHAPLAGCQTPIEQPKLPTILERGGPEASKTDGASRIRRSREDLHVGLKEIKKNYEFDPQTGKLKLKENGTPLTKDGQDILYIDPDFENNELEVYGKNKRHLGAIDPITKNQVPGKNARPERTADGN